MTICGTTIGLAAFLSVSLWPQYMTPIQMALYTTFVFGPLFLGLWAERHRLVFWIGILLTLALHGMLLYSIRSMFPFRTVLVVIPIALVESSVMFILMLKALGDRGAGDTE